MSVTLKSIVACAIINFIVITQTVLASPGGAPGCAANVEAITGAMGAPTGELGYVIEPAATTYTPGTAMNIRITNPNPAITTVKGILLYVMPEANNQQRVGTWVVPASLKDNAANCGAITAEPLSVLTHTDTSDKAILNVDMSWTPGAALTGNMIVRCMIVGSGAANWQILDQVVLTPAAGGGQAAEAGAAAPIVAAPAAPVAGHRKCKTHSGTAGGSSAPVPVVPTVIATTTAAAAPTAVADASAAPISDASAAPIADASAEPSTESSSEAAPADPAAPAAPADPAAPVDPAAPADPAADPTAAVDPATGQEAASTGVDGADVALEQSADPNDPSNIATASGSSTLYHVPSTLYLMIAVFVIMN